ncbi:hypothetical protein BN2476_80129 [Paraburkholderia piptadeniae]|uniref:Uncharacterized protein n=1 Tax=Paraburkholderia piptadeniae TaxID=1701573 RepID=A0A1N7RMA5_9BURK|nr:hypothetical protein BN2476_80129 [Paraburkholderia piptadeniae]
MEAVTDYASTAHTDLCTYAKVFIVAVHLFTFLVRDAIDVSRSVDREPRSRFSASRGAGCVFAGRPLAPLFEKESHTSSCTLLSPAIEPSPDASAARCGYFSHRQWKSRVLPLRFRARCATSSGYS